MCRVDNLSYNLKSKETDSKKFSQYTNKSIIFITTRKYNSASRYEHTKVLFPFNITPFNFLVRKRYVIEGTCILLAIIFICI